AVIAPRYLGLKAVIAVSFARIHWQNLANFGIVPLEFDDPADLEPIGVGDEVVLEGVHQALRGGTSVPATIGGREVALTHRPPASRRRAPASCRRAQPPQGRDLLAARGVQRITVVLRPRMASSRGKLAHDLESGAIDQLQELPAGA